MLTPDEVAGVADGAATARCSALWQTAMLRLSRLRVVDEIENGLAYYRYTFLAEVPRLYRGARRRSSRAAASARRSRVPPFLRMGSWIGGDRDGNPFVDGATRSRYAIRAQAAVAFGHYLDEVHRLGAELSLSTRLVKPTRRAASRSRGTRATRTRTARTSRIGRR